MSRLIKIEPYSSLWPIAYKQLRDVYELHLEGLFQEIQHVGSTSVDGLAAKPILDIDIIIEGEAQLAEIIYRLQDLGYSYVGTLGLPGRHAFTAKEPNVPLKGEAKCMSHNLYVCINGSLSLENHLQFRDYLRAHPESVKEYATLKRELASKARTLEWYVAQKTAFITGVLQNCGFSEDAIDTIRSVNKEGTPE
ncbi:GrpB family protein [Flavobacterium selenitireducens]|uniref:GrpB family protein n=1 Tax=Flavobacterium selenitireducens TaxID=2722704 RepID=UPI00168AC12D|nr:GrpB family protein [Flavobacterium selenitireducens]MBD3581309.1 GrpB family protein [Flavobacterium selenitireducens]